MRARQQFLRALVVDVIADIDEAVREVVLTIHWRGGQHSQLRVRKPKTGEHGCRTPDEALAVMRAMAARWSDEHIAASLNHMGMRTGQGKTWTAHRVGSLRRVHGIHAFRSAEKNGEWLTMRDAAKLLGVSNHAIGRLIKGGILAAEQVAPDAPYQICAADLQDKKVVDALSRKARPCRAEIENQLSMFSNIPCSRDNTEFLWVDDAEIVRDLIAVGAPVPWRVIAQESQHRVAEVLEGAVALFVRGVSVHQPP